MSDRNVKKDKVFFILPDISWMDRNTLMRRLERLLIHMLKTWQNAGMGRSVAFTKPCADSCCLLQPVWAPGVSKAREHPSSFQTLLQLAAHQELSFQLRCTLHRQQQPEDGLWLMPTGELMHSLHCHKNQPETAGMLVPDSPCYQEQREHGRCWTAASSFSTPCFN